MLRKVVPYCAAVNLALLTGFLVMGCTSSSHTEEDRYLEEARAAKQAQQIDEAQKWAKRAVEQELQKGEAHEILAETFRIRAQNKMEAGDASGAHSHFLQAADHEPTTRRRSKDLIAALDAGQQAGLPDDRLLELTQRAIEAAPHNPDLRRHGARLAEDSGDDETAAIHYQWLVSADPDDTGAGLRLGIIYLALGRPGDAAAVLETVHDREPENIQASLNLAGAYVELNRYLDAADLFEMMLEQVPNHPAVLRNYADLEEQRGNHSRARQLRHKATEESPAIEEREMRPLR